MKKRKNPGTNGFSHVVQRVNPLVSNKLQNLNRWVYPSEHQKKRMLRLLRQLLYIFLIYAFFSTINLFGQDGSIRVMSFNIRYDNPSDGINSWDNRKNLVVESLLIDSPDIIGMQEVLKHQMDYLQENMPDYRSIGIGREDGKTSGEYVPVLYKHERFRLLDNGTFWLSETPRDTGSVGWDAALTRICTWGKFIDLPSGREFYCVNTHFDHIGDTARSESARLILDFIHKETNGLPVMLTGDFNCSPDDEPYRTLTSSVTGLTDACKVAATKKDFREGTFNGFGSVKYPQTIDMVFIKGRWEVSSYEVIKIKKDEVFISDHWPVITELKIKN